jgi:hypothetical protein
VAVVVGRTLLPVLQATAAVRVVSVLKLGLQQHLTRVVVVVAAVTH